MFAWRKHVRSHRIEIEHRQKGFLVLELSGKPRANDVVGVGHTLNELTTEVCMGEIRPHEYRLTRRKGHEVQEKKREEPTIGWPVLSVHRTEISFSHRAIGSPYRQSTIEGGRGLTVHNISHSEDGSIDLLYRLRGVTNEASKLGITPKILAHLTRRLETSEHLDRGERNSDLRLVKRIGVVFWVPRV
jgi:hypothetical protein